MEEEKVIEETTATVALSDELLAKIEKRVKELKEKNPKIKKIFPIVVEGDPECDEKELYIGYFRQPSFVSFSKYLTAIQKDQAVAMRALAKDCFIDGDTELYSDDDLFQWGLMGQLSRVLQTRNSRLVNLSKPGK